MKFVNSRHKPISLFVIVVFAYMLFYWTGQTPASPAVPGPEKSSVAAAENSKEESTGSVEKEESAASMRKGKKFPWLIAALVVVAGGAAIYFLSIKKKNYILATSVGTGVTGTPAAGSASHKKGTVVNYNYSLQSGYGDLVVTLDGSAVAASGTVTMNADHALAASAAAAAKLAVNSAPAGARIYLDNADSGFATPHTFDLTSAGTKTVLLRYSCGYQDFTQTVSLNVGQTTNVNATLAAGIKEDFNVPASTCWIPQNQAAWSTEGGVYKFNGFATSSNFNFYSYPFGHNYTITVKMNRKRGPTSGCGIWLGASTSVTNANGYLFYYMGTSEFKIFKLTNYNFITNSGGTNSIKNAKSSAIKGDADTWNTLKIIKAGSGDYFTFYINDVYMFGFGDTIHHSSSYCALYFAGGNSTGETLIDYVHLEKCCGD